MGDFKEPTIFTSSRLRDIVREVKAKLPCGEVLAEVTRRVQALPEFRLMMEELLEHHTRELVLQERARRKL
jgi:hypothetical protein